MIARPHLVRRGIPAILLVLAAAACSTADYAKPVDDFAAATSNARSALSDLNTQVTDAYRGVLDKAILDRKLLAREQMQECQVGSTRCRLILIDREGQEVEPYPPEPPLARMTLLMTQIDGYAASLKALLQADTTQKVEAHVNDALGSVQNLADTVAKMKDPNSGATADVPQFATPVGEAVNWVVGQYVERVKFKGLQRATAAGKPVIRDAADLFTDVSTFASDVPKEELANEVSAAQDAVRENLSQATLSAYAKSAAKYDALLTSSPPDLFQAMGDAHDALADSLRGEGTSLATAHARIEAFAAEAEQLAKILRDLRAIIPEEG